MHTVSKNRNEGVDFGGLHFFFTVRASLAAASALSFSSRCSRKILYSSADRLKKKEGERDGKYYNRLHQTLTYCRSKNLIEQFLTFLHHLVVW